MTRRSLAVIAMTFIILPPSAGAQSPSLAIEHAIAQKAAAQFSLTWLLNEGFARGAPAGAMEGRDFIVQELSSPYKRLRIYRAEHPSLPHHNPILYAIAAGKILQLGGSPSPRLQEVVDLLELRAMTRQEAYRLGKTFATLVDPNGGAGMQQDGKGELQEALVTGPECPVQPELPDTVFSRPWGGFGVRVSHISWNRGYLGIGRWEDVRTAFEFADDGQLLIWDQSTRGCKRGTASESK